MRMDSRFWFTKNGENFLGSGRIQLLKLIDQTGSMQAAAKIMKMSYKAAWERMNSMNLLSDKPLLIKSTGGKGGGGTQLTPYAHELIQTFERFNELHSQFIERFSEAGNDAERLAQILNRTFLTTSARNQVPCKINKIEPKGLESVVTLEFGEAPHSVSINSIITTQSVNNMRLVLGDSAYAIFKARDIHLVDSDAKKDTDTNLFEAQILSINPSEDQAELSLLINGTLTLYTTVSKENCAKNKVGETLLVSIPADHIIVGF